MAVVLLGLGSNQNARPYIKAALTALEKTFGDLVLSPIYESEAIGFDGDNFLNMVVEIKTALSVHDLWLALRDIEDANGRDRSQPKFGCRTLDIDILIYDNYVGTFDGVTLPRDEILENAFVLRPLSDTWPDWLHPVTKTTYQQLWRDYDQSSQKLWPINL